MDKISKDQKKHLPWMMLFLESVTYWLVVEVKDCIGKQFQRQQLKQVSTY